MEDKKISGDKKDSAGDSVGALVFTVGLLFLAGYGLRKLFTEDTDARKSIASQKELDFLEELMGRDKP